MTPEDFLLHIGKHFCDEARWPRYLEMDLHLLETGGVEPLLSTLDRNDVQVIDRDDDEYLRLSSLASYSAYAPCAAVDLTRLGKTAGFFAERSIEAEQTDAAGKLQITAKEIAGHLGISGIELTRLVQLLDQFGSEIQRGGGRGGDFAKWTFTVRSRSRYFRGTNDFDTYLSHLERLRERDRMRQERESAGSSQVFLAAVRDPFDDYPGSGSEYAAALSLALHPAIETASRRLLENGHCAQAIRDGAQRLEAYLQDVLGDYESIGLRLVNVALGGKESRIQLNSGGGVKERDEQSGYHMLARGIVSALRNFIVMAIQRRSALTKP